MKNVEIEITKLKHKIHDIINNAPPERRRGLIQLHLSCEDIRRKHKENPLQGAIEITTLLRDTLKSLQASTNSLTERIGRYNNEVINSVFKFNKEDK